MSQSMADTDNGSNNNNNNNGGGGVDTIRQQKQALRKTIRSKLRCLKQEEIVEQSNSIWQQLWNMEEYQNAKSVGIFLSMPKGEILTYDACNRILQDGKQLYVPRVGLNFEACDMDMIRVNHHHHHDLQTDNYSFYHEWPRNKWGIPEPPSENDHFAQTGDIDLLIVPGLAFDQNGGRLGQGKGYYDRFIGRMRLTENKSKIPLLVAVALNPSFSSSDTIPILPHDHSMDIIITPTTIVKV